MRALWLLLLCGAGAVDLLGGRPSNVSWRLALDLSTAHPGWAPKFAPVPLGPNNYCREWSGPQAGEVRALWWCSANPRVLYGDECPVPGSAQEAYALLCSPRDLWHLQASHDSILGLRLGPAGRNRDSAWLWREQDLRVEDLGKGPDLDRLAGLFDQDPQELLALPSWALAGVTAVVVGNVTVYKWQASVCAPEASPLNSPAGYPAWRYCCRVVGNLERASELGAQLWEACADVPRRLLLPGADALPPEPCGTEGSAQVLCDSRAAPAPWTNASVFEARPARLRCSVYCRWPCRGEALEANECGPLRDVWDEPRTDCADSGLLRLRSCDRSLLSTAHSPCRRGELALATPASCADEITPCTDFDYCRVGRLGCSFARCRCWADASGGAGCCPGHTFCQGHGRLCERGWWQPASERPAAVCQCDEGYVGERCEEELPAGTSCHLSARTRALHGHPVEERPSASPSASGTPTNSPSGSRSPSRSPSPRRDSGTLWLLRSSDTTGLCACARSLAWEACPASQSGRVRCAVALSGTRLLAYANISSADYLSREAAFTPPAGTSCTGGAVPLRWDPAATAVRVSWYWVKVVNAAGQGYYVLRHPCPHNSDYGQSWCLQKPVGTNSSWQTGHSYDSYEYANGVWTGSLCARLTREAVREWASESSTNSATRSWSSSRSLTPSPSLTPSFTPTRSPGVNDLPAVMYRTGGGLCLCATTLSWGVCPTQLSAMRACAVVYVDNQLRYPADPRSPDSLRWCLQVDSVGGQAQWSNCTPPDATIGDSSTQHITFQKYSYGTHIVQGNRGARFSWLPVYLNVLNGKVFFSTGAEPLEFVQVDRTASDSRTPSPSSSRVFFPDAVILQDIETELCLAPRTLTWESCDVQQEILRSYAMVLSGNNLRYPGDPLQPGYMAYTLGFHCNSRFFEWRTDDGAALVGLSSFNAGFYRMSIHCGISQSGYPMTLSIRGGQLGGPLAVKYDNDVGNPAVVRLSVLDRSIPDSSTRTPTTTRSPSVSATTTRSQSVSATNSRTPSWTPTRTRTRTPSSSVRPPAVVLRDVRGRCLWPSELLQGRAAWAACPGDTRSEAALALHLHAQRSEWPASGTSLFIPPLTYALAALSPTDCAAWPAGYGAAANFSLALAPAAPADGLQRVEPQQQARPGTYALRFTGCGLDHWLLAGVGWVPAGRCAGHDGCLLTLTPPGVAPTPSGSITPSQTTSRSFSPTNSPTRSPVLPFAFVDAYGRCLSLKQRPYLHSNANSRLLYVLFYQDCQGGQATTAESRWYEITNYGTISPTCYYVEAVPEVCMRAAGNNRQYNMYAQAGAWLIGSGWDSCLVDRPVAYNAQLSLLEFGSICGLPLMYLARDLVWSNSLADALVLTKVSSPPAAPWNNPTPTPLPPPTGLAGLGKLRNAAAGLCLTINGTDNDRLQRLAYLRACNASSLVDSDQYVIANDKGVYWSGDAASPDYLRYRLASSNHVCYWGSLVWVTRDQVLPGRAEVSFSDADGRIWCSSGSTVESFMGFDSYSTLFLDIDVVSVATYGYPLAFTGVTRSPSSTQSVTPSRTPSVSVSPRSFVYETQQGYVNLLVSRLLANASGEELLLLGAAGQVARLVASDTLDPRDGLAVRSDHWCTLAPDQERLRYSVTFAAGGARWYSNATHVTTAAPAGGGSEWFELRLTGLGARVVRPLYSGPLYELANGGGGCVGLRDNETALALVPCGSNGAALYLLTQLPTPSRTPTSSVTPSWTPTISVTPSWSLTSSVTPSRTPTISITPTITPSATSTPGPMKMLQNSADSTWCLEVPARYGIFANPNGGYYAYYGVCGRSPDAQRFAIGSDPARPYVYFSGNPTDTAYYLKRCLAYTGSDVLLVPVSQGCNIIYRNNQLWTEDLLRVVCVASLSSTGLAFDGPSSPNILSITLV